MSNNHRFKLSHLMPNSWFYKLRDMKRPMPPSQRSSETARVKKSSNYYHGTTTPKPLPLSPHRQFYPYPKTKETPLAKLRPTLSTLHLNLKEAEIKFSRNHHQHLHDHHQSSISATVEGSYNKFQELQLRPIRTRPEPTGSTSAISSGTCPSSPKLRSRRLHQVISGGRVSTSSAGGGRRSVVARKSFAIVKASMDPRRDFRESMVEMITENKVHAPEDLQELLECYLSLNSSEYHGLIMEVFRAIWLEIADDVVED